MNDSISCSPEISVIANSTTLFMGNDFESLLAYNGNGDVDITQKSLFNFENIMFVIQNSNNTANINT